jgi:hypothetical protein
MGVETRDLSITNQRNSLSHLRFDRDRFSIDQITLSELEERSGVDPGSSLSLIPPFAARLQRDAEVSAVWEPLPYNRQAHGGP